MLCTFQHPPGSGRLRSFIASKLQALLETISEGADTEPRLNS
jgi:hypothetical protein